MSKPILVVEDQPDNRQIIRDMLKAREAGCDDYVPKPFSPRQLLAKIRQYLQ